MPPAVRLSDKAVISADKHGCPACPHPGFGPAVNGSTNVFINKLPAIRLGDPGIHMACCGPNQWKTDKGSSTVYVNGKPLVRMGDKTKHCGGDGKMIMGSPNVFADDGGSGAGALGSLVAQALKAGQALLDKYTGKKDNKSGSWKSKDAKGKAGKGGKKGKGGKDGKKDGKKGGAKGGKGGADGPDDADGTAGGGGGGGGGANDGTGDLSSDVEGSENIEGEGIIRVILKRPATKPGTELPFQIDCRTKTQGSIKVKAVLLDADNNEVATTKETSVEAALEATGSLVFSDLHDDWKGEWDTPEKTMKWIENTLNHPSGTRKFRFLLRAEHDKGNVDSPDGSCDLDAVMAAVEIKLYEELDPATEDSDQPTGKAAKELVKGNIKAKVKLAGIDAPFNVVFRKGLASIPNVTIDPTEASEGDEDPRVESVEFEDKKLKKYAWKAFVPAKG